MAIDNLFNEEDNRITLASQVLSESSLHDNPLHSNFSELLNGYIKLNKQLKRIIKLSDKQHFKLSVINREMKHILDNIPVGIAIIEKNGKINPAYSQYMHHLFGYDRKIGDAAIESVLYFEEEREKDRVTLSKWLSLVFDLSYNWDLIGGLGPDVIRHDTLKGPFYYRHSFHRIIHENGDLFLMVYITDITDRIRQKIALKEQETAHNFELEIFSCIVNQDTSVELIDYINETERMLNESTRLFETIPAVTNRKPLYNHLFRLMHSIKGLARTYGMNEFARLAHAAEDILNKYRGNEISFESGLVDGVLASDRLNGLIEKMKKLLINGEKIIRKIFHQGKENAAAIRSRRRGLKIDPEKLEDIMKNVESMKDALGPEHPMMYERLNNLNEQIYHLTLQPLDVVYNRLHQIVKDVSDSLGKKAELTTEGVSLNLPPSTHHQIITSMIHLLRNALDHGIEPPELREELGKDPTGRINLLTMMTNKDYRIELSDDGAGINPDDIAEIALNKGFVSNEEVAAMSDSEKTALILIPGFSCKKDVTDISGRGVGMDVVSETMKDLGGRLIINSELDRGTTFIIEFPIHVNKETG